jgi:hypothetical protein
MFAIRAENRVGGHPKIFGPSYPGIVLASPELHRGLSAADYDDRIRVINFGIMKTTSPKPTIKTKSRLSTPTNHNSTAT